MEQTINITKDENNYSVLLFWILDSCLIFCCETCVQPRKCHLYACPNIQWGVNEGWTGGLPEWWEPRSIPSFKRADYVQWKHLQCQGDVVILSTLFDNGQGDGGDLLLHFPRITSDLNYKERRFSQNSQLLWKHIKYQSWNACLISHALKEKMYGLNMSLLRI